MKPKLFMIAALAVAVGSVAGAAVRVERAVVPLTHEAVARGYNPKFGGYPVVGDPAAPETERWADLFFRYHFTLTNDGPKAVTVQAMASSKPADFAVATEFRVEPGKLELAPGQTARVTLVVKVPGEAAAKLPAGYTRDLEVRFAGEGIAGGAQKVVFWVPAVAKILAGADGQGLPADVCPAGADYADEFAGGWDGARFKQPFLVMSGREVEARRKMVTDGFKPLHNVDYPFPKADLGQQPDYVSINALPDQPPHGSDIGGGMLDLALRWAYTGDRKFAEKVRELALAIINRADRLGRGSKGRMGFNPLSEAWTAAPVFFAFDLVSGAGVFTPEEEQRIKEWMRYETTLMRQIFAYSNQQTEENLANFAAGLLDGDFRHLRFAYYPPYGSEGQLSGAFYADGFHREHQPGYHFRSINPICEQAEVLLRLGFCAYDDRTHRALMQQVLAIVGPGDSLGGEAVAACELAALRYRDPAAAFLLRGRGRFQLHHGGGPLPEGSDSAWKGGSHMPGSGETVLRAPDGRRGVAFGWGRPEKRGAKDFMDYRLFYSDGQKGFAIGGGQFGIVETLGHNCIIANENVEATPGVPVEMQLEGDFPYVVAENPGPKPMSDTDLAHPWPYPWIWPNAGDVNGINWPLGLPYPHAGKGKWWREWKPMPGVARWSRTVAMVEGGFLIADAVELEAPGRLERPVHVGNVLTSLPRLGGFSVPLTPVDEPLGRAPIYLAAQSSTLKGEKYQEGYPGDAVVGETKFPRARTDDSWSFTARMGEDWQKPDGVGVTATMLGAPNTEVIQVPWLKGAWGKCLPFMIARRENVKQTRFVAFIEPYGEWRRKTDAAPRFKGMKRLAVTDADGKVLSDEQGAAVELDFGGKRVVVLLNDSGKQAKVGGLSTTRRFAAGYAE
jgi:hypothetical protein